MSQFAPIAPIQVLKQLRKESPELFGKYHLVLAHEVLAAPGLFAEVYCHEGYEVILDNSVVELGHAMNPEDLLEAASIVNADVIVLPDVIGDSKETIRVATVAHHRMKANAIGVEFMAVPQGKTHHEVLQCAYHLEDALGSGLWIGIPRWITDKLGSRIYTVVNVVNIFDGPIHLLGFSNNLADDIACARLPEVKGIDSSVPFLYGAHWKTLWIDPHMERPNREEVWNENMELNYCMKHNLRAVRHWLGLDPDRQDVKNAPSKEKP